tara:strand:+ start:2230 stop:2649 length:420 start_codon:yes stop_codon:yes gene_type:complete
MKIEVSNGEIIDKYTILEIKLSKIKDSEKLINIQHEYNTLTPYVNSLYDSFKSNNQLKNLHFDLQEVNRTLWGIEDAIRECERTNQFGEHFINLAQSVYYVNDSRSDIKKRINIFTGSDLIEEKSYKKYDRATNTKEKN